MQLSDEDATDEGRPAPQGLRPRTIIFIVLAIMVVVLVSRSLVLNAFATEGGVPDSAAVRLPIGAEVVSTRVECASGGCWRIVQVHPADGQSPADLAEQIGATPTLKLAGNLFEPRTIWVSAEVKGGLLELHLDFWSGPSSR